MICDLVKSLKKQIDLIPESELIQGNENRKTGYMSWNQINHINDIQLKLAQLEQAKQNQSLEPFAK